MQPTRAITLVDRPDDWVPTESDPPPRFVPVMSGPVMTRVVVIYARGSVTVEDHQLIATFGLFEGVLVCPNILTGRDAVVHGLRQLRDNPLTMTTTRP